MAQIAAAERQMGVRKISIDDVRVTGLESMTASFDNLTS